MNPQNLQQEGDGQQDVPFGEVAAVRNLLDDVDEAAIISGSDACHDDDGEAELKHEGQGDWSSDDAEDGLLERRRNDQKEDGLFCDNMDEEDAAWVYKNLRGGQEETVTVRRDGRKKEQKKNDKDLGNTTSAASEQEGEKVQSSISSSSMQRDQIKVLKPRDSDAVLSCPCCFATVCMDCQQHDTYKHQYRAMFVMNIAVDWTELRWDDDAGCLLPREVSHKVAENKVPHFEEEDESNTFQDIYNEDVASDQTDAPEETPKEVGRKSLASDAVSSSDDPFHTVYCLQCYTQVAFLNMVDEVYHFVDCIATSS
jgi:hypothetical protein